MNLYFTPSKVTSDFIVDRLEEWWEGNRARYPEVEAAAGPGQRAGEPQPAEPVHATGWCGWRRRQQLTMELAYYPPYHSKYNPIERCWGVLEVYWNGELLDSEAAVLGFAGNMTYAGRHPRVSRVDQTYASGVCRSTKEMKRMEHYLQRRPGLEKWSVVIPPPEVDDLFS